MDDVLARASVSVGTLTDEYLDREPHRTAALNFFDGELARGESRLKELNAMIGHFKFVKTAMLTRFPELKASSTDQPVAKMESDSKAVPLRRGREIPYVFAERRNGDVATCYASADLARRLLGWRPARTVEDMCRDAWKWQSLNPDGYGRAHSG